MRKILSLPGVTIVALTPTQTISFPKQPRGYVLRRVFFLYTLNVLDAVTCYFRLNQLDGAGSIVARASTSVGVAGTTAVNGSVSFSEVATASTTVTDSLTSRHLFASIGNNGMRVESCESLQVVFLSNAAGGNTQDVAIGSLFFHCDFDEDSD